MDDQTCPSHCDGVLTLFGRPKVRKRFENRLLCPETGQNKGHPTGNPGTSPRCTPPYFRSFGFRQALPCALVGERIGVGSMPLVTPARMPPPKGRSCGHSGVSEEPPGQTRIPLEARVHTNTHTPRVYGIAPVDSCHCPGPRQPLLHLFHREVSGDCSQTCTSANLQVTPPPKSYKHTIHSGPTAGPLWNKCIKHIPPPPHCDPSPPPLQSPPRKGGPSLSTKRHRRYQAPKAPKRKSLWVVLELLQF